MTDAGLDSGSGVDTVDNPRIRCTERVLDEVTLPVTVGDLAERVHRFVADGEGTPSRADVHEDLFERVLPELDRRGQITFEVDVGLVRRATDPSPGVVARTLDGTRRSPYRATALTVPLSALLVTTVAGFDPVVMIGAGAVGGGLLLTLAKLIE